MSGLCPALAARLLSLEPDLGSGREYLTPLRRPRAATSHPKAALQRSTSPWEFPSPPLPPPLLPPLLPPPLPPPPLQRVRNRGPHRLKRGAVPQVNKS